MKNLISFLFLSSSILMNAQIVNQKSIDSTNILAPVEINIKQQSPERLPEIKNNILFSGKKNEVLRLASINGNLTKNNTREIFARIPGVTIWENESSGLQTNIGVRGLSPNRSWELNTRQNGVDISSDVFGYPEAYYSPSLEAVETIQLVRGGASLQFGPQFGGMLNYVIKKETEKPFSFETQNTIGSFNLLSTFNAIGGKLNNWSYYIYNQSKSGRGWRDNNQYSSSNNYGFIEYRFSNKTKLSAEYSNADYQMQQPGGLTDVQFETNAKQSIRKRNWFGAPWNVFSINFDTKFSNNLDVNFKAFGLIGERNSVGFTAPANINDIINTATNQYNNRRVDIDLYKNFGIENRNLYKYKLGKFENNLAFGFRMYQAKTVRYQRGKGSVNSDFDLSTDGLFPTELTFFTKNLAFFAENQFKITNKLSITPGFRFEYINSIANGRLDIVSGNEILIQEQRTRQQPLFGLGIEYKLKTTNFYANITQAFRPVLFSDLTPTAVIDVVDPNLKDASGFNADLGYRGVYKGFVNFDFSLFYLSYNNRIGGIRNFINGDPTQGTFLFRTNLGQTVNQGIESFVDLNMTKMLDIDKQYGNIDFFASMSFIDSKYIDFITTSTSGTIPNTIISETNLKGNRVENAPRYISNFGVSFSKNNFSATVQYKVSGKVFTDANNTLTPSSNAQTGLLKAYDVADCSLEYKFFKNFNVRSGVNNIFNKSYATRRSSGYPGPGILPGEGQSFYVSIGAKL